MRLAVFSVAMIPITKTDHKERGQLVEMNSVRKIATAAPTYLDTVRHFKSGPSCHLRIQRDTSVDQSPGSSAPGRPPGCFTTVIEWTMPSGWTYASTTSPSVNPPYREFSVPMIVSLVTLR